MTKEKTLLLKIARNKYPQEVFDFLKSKNNKEEQDILLKKSPYKEYVKIVTEQMELDEMMLPEPWNGHISKAKVMFISSNPSIDKYEKSIFPTKKSSDDDIYTFFDGRFSEEKYFSRSRYWSGIKKYMKWLYYDDEKMRSIIEEKSNSYIFNKYVVLTEVVHCKSTRERGVKNCINIEQELFPITDIVELFKGDYIFIIGDYANKFAEQIKKIAYEKGIKVIDAMGAPSASVKGKDKKPYTDSLRKARICHCLNS